MRHFKTDIADVIVFEPDVHKDERGCFFESFIDSYFNDIVGRKINFVQENQSYSNKNVLRGMHYQKSPMQQGKLVRVVAGSVYDVALDIRKESPSYGKWISEVLSNDNKRQLWIPEGFAHGFLSLEDNSQVIYKTTNYYSKDHEEVIKYDDSNYNIVWPIRSLPIQSIKDST
tara:strand:- start:5069 stop:5584 length:516 start_codon:yes stop_codon:yes gene_type:complete